jgi:hypothetical protein
VAPELAVGLVDLYELDAGTDEMAGEAGAIGAGAVHPDAGQGYETRHPPHQAPRSRRARRGTTRSKDPAHLVDHGGDVDRVVGIDTTGDETLLIGDAGSAFPSLASEGPAPSRPGQQTGHSRYGTKLL